MCCFLLSVLERATEIMVILSLAGVFWDSDRVEIIGKSMKKAGDIQK